MLKSRHKYISTTFNNKTRGVMNSNRLRWSQALNSLKTSESETRAKYKNSLDDERVEKTTGEGLLCTD
jgi:hypothetical protein